MSFKSNIRNGILTLSLDTQGSDVNIFNEVAASSLQEGLAKIDSTIRAVVIQSNKPLSFINGAQLMLANMIYTAEDAERLCKSTRDAYASIAKCSVPTIAAVRGNCYGCGVEFILNCDYRVAADSYATHFYMTELADYLLSPVFGSTQRLPPLMGLDKANDFLLWGEQLSAATAKRYGLVDAVFAPHEFNTAVDAFIETILKKRSKKKKSPKLSPVAKSVVKRHQQILEALPPRYHTTYRDCLNILVNTAKRNGPSEAGFRDEALKGVKSLATPDAKAALSFFFIRRTAEAVSLRGESEPSQNWSFSFDDTDATLKRFQRRLQSRKADGIEFCGGKKTASVGDHFHFQSPHPPTSPEVNTISTILSLTSSPLSTPAPIVFYQPGFSKETSFAEILVSKGHETRSHSLYRSLSRLGYRMVPTASGSSFVLNDWLVAYLAPLAATCLEGVDAGSVNSALRDFGFVRRAPSLLEKLGSPALLADMIRPALPEPHQSVDKRSLELVIKNLRDKDFNRAKKPYRAKTRLANALCLSLLGVATKGLREKRLAHPSLADLIAREWLDFPLHLTSLCRYLTVSRVATILASENRTRWNQWLNENTLREAEQYAAGPRGFYL